MVLNWLSNRRRFEFRCAECGEVHKGSPSFSFAQPAHYFDVPESERKERVVLDEDICAIKPLPNCPEDETRYFIRVTLGIPIKKSKEPFHWGVWVSQSKESVNRYIDTAGEDQSHMSSFGWLTVNMPFYDKFTSDDELVNLECDVNWGAKVMRPSVSLWPSDHPLAVDQNEGIDWKRAEMIANLVGHQST